MATLAQALALLLAQPQPPWSTQSLRTLFNSKSLSLRSVLNAVSARKFLLFVEVRPASLLNGNPTLPEFLERWAAPTSQGIEGSSGNENDPEAPKPLPAQLDTIKSLQKSVKPLGLSIAYVSLDAGTIGIAGTYSSFLQMQAITLKDPNGSPGGQNQSGLSNLGQGLVGLGASFAALGAAGAALGASSALVAGLLVAGGFLGFIAAGLFVGVAIYQLIAGSETPTESSQITTTTSPTDPNQGTPTFVITDNQGTQTITFTDSQGQTTTVTILPGTVGLTPEELSQQNVEDLLKLFQCERAIPRYGRSRA